MFWLLLTFGFTFPWLTHAAEAADSRLHLEGAFVIGGEVPRGTGRHDPYVRFGFSARANLQLGQWMFGLTTRGLFSSSAPVRVSADSVVASGDLVRREASLGPVFRYFPSTNFFQDRYYVEAGMLAVQNELVQANQVFDFEQEEGEERLFIRGYGFSFGGGVKFAESPWLIQLNYEYKKYTRAQVVGVRKKLNYVIEEPALQGSFITHALMLSVGISGAF